MAVQNYYQSKWHRRGMRTICTIFHRAMDIINKN